MPRNSAPKRKVVKNQTVSKATTKMLTSLQNFSLEKKEKLKQAQHAIGCLVRLGSQEGTIQDWMFVHYRIILGLYILQHYFERNDEAEQVLSAGLDVLACMIIRVHVRGHFVLFMNELDNVTEALNFASEIMVDINLVQLKNANFEVNEYYNRTISKNMDSYPAEELERIKMVAQLQEEKKQIQNKHLKAA